MNRKISKKTIYILVGVLLFAIIATIGGMRTYYRWTSVQYFGEIVEIKNGDFLMSTDEAQKLLVSTDANTRIRKGREIWAEPLQVGDLVIVVGSPRENGPVAARVIRLIASPRPQL